MEKGGLRSWFIRTLSCVAVCHVLTSKPEEGLSCLHLLFFFFRLSTSAATLSSLTTAPQQLKSLVQKQAEAELLSLHKEERRAHFSHDVEGLLGHIAAQLLDVRDGRINRTSREDVRNRFLEYFKQSQFSVWDDVEPPIVHASSDGKIGWMIVRVRIAYTKTDASGKRTSENIVGAWMSAYEKLNEKWVMTAVTSTFGES